MRAGMTNVDLCGSKNPCGQCIYICKFVICEEKSEYVYVVNPGS
jgi:hypothetical protein